MSNLAELAVTEHVGGLVVGESSVSEQVIPQPFGYMVLIEPVRIEDKTAGGIALLEETVENRQFLRNLGRVVRIGPAAFCGDASLANWGDISEGTWVLHDAYNGFVFPVEDDHGRVTEYRLIKDNQIWAAAPSPQALLRRAR